MKLIGDSLPFQITLHSAQSITGISNTTDSRFPKYRECFHRQPFLSSVVTNAILTLGSV